jgi:hypothetical protein
VNKIKNILSKLIGVLIGLLLFVGTLYLLLILFEKHEQKKVLKASQSLQKVFSVLSDYQVFYDHAIFGSAPHSEVNYKLTYNNELIFDQTYFSNEFLMRVPLAHKEKRKFHAIFAGCSFTWGEGLEPKETFPWIFQESFKNVNAYNLGFIGGGLGLSLRYDELFDYKKGVKEDEGIFVYTFFFDHLDRFLATFRYLAWADQRQPYYEVEKNRPVFKGKIGDQPIYKKFMMLRESGLEKSAITTQSTDGWSDKELRDFALSVKELARNYKIKYPKGKFYFVIHPKDDFKDGERLIKELVLTKIKVLDPTKEYRLMLQDAKKTTSDMQFPDGHPNALFNRFFGPWLAAIIKKDIENLK